MFPVFNLDSYPGDTNRSCMTSRQVSMQVRKINQPSHMKKKQHGFQSAVSLTATLRHVSRESTWKKGLFLTGSQPSFSLTFPPGLVPHNEYEAHRAPEKKPPKNQVFGGGSDKKNKNRHSIVKRSIIIWSWSEWDWLNLVGGSVPMMLPKIGLQTWSHLSHSFGLQGFQLRHTVSKGCSVLFVTCAINMDSSLLTLTHQAISRFLFTTPSNLLPFTNPCDLL